ncbi:MAG: glucoamylase family protein, partial [Steroidobacteraceae bacterium]
FWDTANPRNGLVPDRYPGPSWASIAAVGFALTAYPIGVERGYVTRAAARARVLTTLRFFAATTEQHGFFYHFIDMQHGERRNRSEVSTVDTALLLAGVLVCQSYFDGEDPQEAEIRRLADDIYGRVDWVWAEHWSSAVVMGWTPEDGFSHASWLGYNEAMLVYILALGSPTHAARADAWRVWTSTYDQQWGTLYGQTHLSFAPLFGHQYSHVWVDFRLIRDAYMRGRDLDYFENSRRATYAQQRYAIENPRHWRGYGESLWGLTACEGPGDTRQLYEGEARRFYGYQARGVGLEGIVDDGTIAPTAVISSLPFAPEIVIPATLEMYRRIGGALYSTYGFRDAFNLSFNAGSPARAASGWFDAHYLAIDQGPILAMIENYRSGLVWRIMRHNGYIRRGLERAGFQGGWLQNAPRALPPERRSPAHPVSRH